MNEVPERLINHYIEIKPKSSIAKCIREGLIIKTALDSRIQQSANLSLIEGLIEYEKKQGWDGLIENTNLLIKI